MNEILLVGPSGAPGVAKTLPTGQLRLSWLVNDGDNSAAVLSDASGSVVDRYPGACPGVTADGPLWLLDLPQMPAEVTRIDLSVTFHSGGFAGFDAMVGDRSWSHPGAGGQSGQERLVARLTRSATGWALVPFDRPVDGSPFAPPRGASGATTGSTGADHAQPEDRSSRTGRLVVLVDASGSMVGALRSGAVAGAVLDAVQTSGRPEVALRAAGGVRGATTLGATTLGADIATFCGSLVEQARHSRSQVVETLLAVAADNEDDVVVVSDAAPPDPALLRDVFAGRHARWVIVGPAARAAFGPDRRRIEELLAAGVGVRTLDTH